MEVVLVVTGTLVVLVLCLVAGLLLSPPSIGAGSLRKQDWKTLGIFVAIAAVSIIVTVVYDAFLK